MATNGSTESCLSSTYSHSHSVYSPAVAAAAAAATYATTATSTVGSTMLSSASSSYTSHASSFSTCPTLSSTSAGSLLTSELTATAASAVFSSAPAGSRTFREAVDLDNEVLNWSSNEKSITFTIACSVFNSLIAYDESTPIEQIRNILAFQNRDSIKKVHDRHGGQNPGLIRTLSLIFERGESNYKTLSEHVLDPTYKVYTVSIAPESKIYLSLPWND